MTPRKDPSLFPLTLIMLPVYFTNRNHPRWVGLGPFNKFKCSMLTSRVEKSPLKSHMQRKEDSRDLILKICFAYLRTSGIWYGDDISTSLSRTTLRTKRWSILPPEPRPTLNSESCWDINKGILWHTKTQDWGYPAEDHSRLPASDSQLWLPTGIIWGALKSKLHSRPIQHEGPAGGGVGGRHCVHGPGDANVQPGWKMTALGQRAQ